MEQILQQITQYADRAHGTQMRKYTPERYIVHPIRVMQTCRQYDERLPILAAALLHDVLEDTAVQRDEMLVFLKSVMTDEQAQQTLELVIEMTDVYVKADYPKLNRRHRKANELVRILETSADAQTIKYADILDNTNEIASNDPGFANRFLRECLAILEQADKGNSALHEIALKSVRKALADLKC